MAENTITYRTKVSLPLKSRDRTIACPEVDRCQLEVIENDHSDALTIEDGEAYYRKLVKVGLVQEGGGCDVKVRIGVVAAGGLCACGLERYQKTRIETVRTNTVSGQYISTTVSESTVAVDIETPTGSTIETSSTTEGFDTLTTTTTVTVYAESWEKLLDPCADPADLFLPAMPRHIINARYAYKNVVATVVTFEAMDDASWHVVVARRGDVKSSEKLHLTFPRQSGTELRVSAALSVNLNSVYIVESVKGSGSVSATAHWYTFYPPAGEWSRFVSGQVSDPSDGGSNYHRFVDRNGDIYGYWRKGTDTARIEQYLNPDGTCGYSGAGIDYTRRWHTATVVGKVFNILSGLYSDNPSRFSGPIGGQFGRLSSMEESTTTEERLVEHSQYEWAVEYSDDSAVYTRAGSGSNDYELSYAVSAANTTLPDAQDEGLRKSFSGSSTQTVSEISPPQPPNYFDKHVEITISFTGWSYTDGYSALDVGPGGWITHTEMFEVKTADMSSIYNEYDADANNVVIPCPQFSLESQAVTSQRDAKNLVYPIDLGEVYAVYRSFSTVDEITNSFWAGVEYNTEDGGEKEWRVFRDGVEMTSAVAACIGRPLTMFSGVFWRV